MPKSVVSLETYIVVQLSVVPLESYMVVQLSVDFIRNLYGRAVVCGVIRKLTFPLMGTYIIDNNISSLNLQ